jgi:hypothetical protein
MGARDSGFGVRDSGFGIGWDGMGGEDRGGVGYVIGHWMVAQIEEMTGAGLQS